MMITFRPVQVGFAILVLALPGCTPPAGQNVPSKPAVSSAVSSEGNTRAELARARAEFVAAYDAVDLDRFVAMFADGATYSGLRQTTWVRGKDEIRSMWAIAFTKDKARNFEFDEPLTYVSPDNNVAVDAGYADMMMAPQAHTPVAAMQKMPMRVSITWIRTDQGWKIINMAASPKEAVAAGFLNGH
jgi:ketosteroid isomerase-like protein